jgi:hypothetical protein
MKIPAIQRDIVSHLRSLGGAETSRALATRFLRIDNADEETCRRLLAPFLATVPGVVHRPEEGWSLSAGTPPASVPPAEEGEQAAAGRVIARADSLRDFVALSSEGTGPGGSGAVARVCLVPVVAGEECQEEIFPDWGADEDAYPAAAPPGGALPPAVLEEMIQTIGDLPVVCHRAAREVEPLRRLCAESGLPFQAPVISAAKLGHLLLGLKANHAAAELALALGVETRGPDDCRGRARIVAASFLRMASLLEERGIDSPAALLEYQDMPAAPLDLSAFAFTSDDLKRLPAGPGAYRFLDREDRVVYVGKAKNLRARVSSYFIPSARGTAKGRAILERVHRFEVEPVASELEANLLEAALIAEHRPPLNRQFDVHERSAPYGPRLNLVVVLRDAGPAEPVSTCTLHFLNGGRYVGRIARLAPGGGDADEGWVRSRDFLARHYFPGTSPAGLAPGGRTATERAGDEGADIDWQLVASFLRRNADEVNVLDVDECPSPAEAESRLRVLAAAAVAAPGRILAR